MERIHRHWKLVQSFVCQSFCVRVFYSTRLFKNKMRTELQRNLGGSSGMDRNKKYWKIRTTSQISEEKNTQQFKCGIKITKLRWTIEIATIRTYILWVCVCVCRESNQVNGAYTRAQKCTKTIKMQNALDHLLPNLLFRVYPPLLVLYFASIRHGHLNHPIFFSQLNDLNLFCVQYACPWCTRLACDWINLSAAGLFFFHLSYFVINKRKRCTTRCWCISILPHSKKSHVIMF